MDPERVQPRGDAWLASAVSLLAAASALPSCGGDEPMADSSGYRCVQDRNACQCGDPAAGDHCCASIGDDRGYCECSPGECGPGKVEVSECSPDTALAVCPTSFTEVASCMD